MQGILKWITEFWNDNYNEVIVGVLLLFIGWIVTKVWSGMKKVPKNINEILNGIDQQSENWKEELTSALGIKETMNSRFPEYKDFLLIQYGSSVKADNKLPSDYDFIVLMLGYPENEVRYMHNKGTMSDILSSENKNHVDIVFRDYLSFLFAASAGMPYENSVITGGKLIKGHEGYFQWLNNITKNILFDRDFLVRRFNDKIAIEKEELFKCLKEHNKFEHDKYYVIRAGYYYITSLLQLKKIKSFEKVVIQKDVVELANVRNFYQVFQDDEVKNKYIMLVESLKRNTVSEQLTIDDIKMILSKLDI
ncbi:hypothetical protein [Clostridium algidicarnis]|uniref:hypothetical protein n=1 Tax=Clostridium algidicarnis TaxID=37659 RepID=UPI003FD7210F